MSALTKCLDLIWFVPAGGKRSKQIWSNCASAWQRKASLLSSCTACASVIVLEDEPLMVITMTRMATTQSKTEQPRKHQWSHLTGETSRKTRYRLLRLLTSFRQSLSTLNSPPLSSTSLSANSDSPQTTRSQRVTFWRSSQTMPSQPCKWQNWMNRASSLCRKTHGPSPASTTTHCSSRHQRKQSRARHGRETPRLHRILMGRLMQVPLVDLPCIEIGFLFRALYWRNKIAHELSNHSTSSPFQRSSASTQSQSLSNREITA